MLLLTNGTIATMDPARPMAEAAVVAGRTPRTSPAAFPGEPGRLWISRAAL